MIDRTFPTRPTYWRGRHCCCNCIDGRNSRYTKVPRHLPYITSLQLHGSSKRLESSENGAAKGSRPHQLSSRCAGGGGSCRTIGGEMGARWGLFGMHFVGRPSDVGPCDRGSGVAWNFPCAISQGGKPHLGHCIKRANKLSLLERLTSRMCRSETAFADSRVSRQLVDV